jgi:DNA-binding response OmpR family regulator
MARDVNGFTPTQARIAYVLQDGKWHSQEELLKAIDEYATSNLLNVHISKIRAIVDKRNEVIVCQTVAGRVHYRHGILLAPMING